MPWWQLALIALVLAWMLQAVGGFYQMRHYRAVMGDVSARWADGFVGAGSARAILGRGVLLLLVVSPDRIVRRLLVMHGRSIFTRFEPVSAVEGLPMERLGSEPVFRDKKRGKALAIALAQVEKAVQRRTA